jgi:hypothetical protein
MFCTSCIRKEMPRVCLDTGLDTCVSSKLRDILFWWRKYHHLKSWLLNLLDVLPPFIKMFCVTIWITEVQAIIPTDSKRQTSFLTTNATSGGDTAPRQDLTLREVGRTCSSALSWNTAKPPSLLFAPLRPISSRYAQSPSLQGRGPLSAPPFGHCLLPNDEKPPLPKLPWARYWG